jgi:hypothetical protein
MATEPVYNFLAIAFKFLEALILLMNWRDRRLVQDESHVTLGRTSLKRDMSLKIHVVTLLEVKQSL